MKKLAYFTLVLVLLASCGGKSSHKSEASQSEGAAAHVTQVLCFHSKQRCATCILMEKLAQEVVDSIHSDSVVIKVIDISKSENEAIADKYKVSWSSLVLDHGGKVNDFTETAFKYARTDSARFKALLREAIAGMAH